jgi:hypothetical protein
VSARGARMASSVPHDGLQTVVALSSRARGSPNYHVALKDGGFRKQTVRIDANDAPDATHENRRCPQVHALKTRIAPLAVPRRSGAASQAHANLSPRHPSNLSELWRRIRRVGARRLL